MAENNEAGKAQDDLAKTRAGVSKVALSLAHLGEVIDQVGLDQGGAAQEGLQEENAAAPADAAAEPLGAGVPAPGDASVPQADAFAPAAAVPQSTQTVYGQPMGYGQVPVAPAALSSVQPAYQAQPANPGYAAQPTAPLQQPLAGQAPQGVVASQAYAGYGQVPGAAPVPPAYNHASATQQMPAQSAFAQQPQQVQQPQPAADVRATVPGQAPASGQVAQAYNPNQPTQAQPAYNQAYMPQVQQPVYDGAQGFAPGPQPSTPAYEKSNKSTLAIVIAVVVGIVAIIAAIAIGSALARAGYDSYIYDEMDDYYDANPFADEWDNYMDDYYDTNPFSDDYDDLYGWDGNDYDDLYGWDDDYTYGDGGGVTHIEGGGIDADDGELHDAWDRSVSYKYHEEEYSREGLETIDAYGGVIAYDFDVDYPQLEGDIPELDKVNTAIRDKAMHFVDVNYTNPTAESRRLMDTFAGDSYGVPSGADGILESDVDYAIMYNNEDFISIAFSDECAFGSWMGSTVTLRTININLKTGEVYELDDVLEVNRDVAEAFVDNLSFYDGGRSSAIAEGSLASAIMGKGELADRVSPTFFVDGNGKVNLGVSYQLSDDDGFTRGWWDYTLTDEQLEKGRKSSEMYDLL